MTATRINPQREIHVINEQGQSRSTSTSWSYTGVTFTIPANSIYGITARGMFNKSECTGCCMSTSSTDMVPYQRYGYDASSSSCSVSGFTATNITLYVWTKYAASGNNAAFARGWYITLPAS